MAAPVLTPKSNSSVSVLPPTGSTDNVLSSLATNVYASDDFISGAVDQVTYTYRKLGGDVLDIEIKEESVYAAYEEACLEYSYLVNIHQSKNILSDIFDPFSTTKMGGSGLGLPLVAKIISEHGGFVELDDMSEGACFKIYLPAGDTSLSERMH